MTQTSNGKNIQIKAVKCTQQTHTLGHPRRLFLTPGKAGDAGVRLRNFYEYHDAHT